MPALTRDEYAAMNEQQLRSRLASARDRMARADTNEAYLSDCFAEQEIEAALRSKGAHTYTGHAR